MKRNKDVTLKDALREMVKELKLAKPLTDVKVKEIWQTMMGPSINKYTQSIYLKKDVLYVQISSAPLKNELSYGKEKIKHIINKELGAKLLAEVVIY